MKGAAAPSSVMTAASVRTSIKIQEQQSAAAPSPSSVPETNGSSISTNEGGNNQETEGLVNHICIYMYMYETIT